MEQIERIKKRRVRVGRGRYASLKDSFVRSLIKRVFSNILSQRVSAVMTRDVVKISPKQNLLEAAYLMLKEGIASLVVYDSKAVGIITEQDYLRIEPADSMLERSPVSSLMSTHLVTVGPAHTVYEANEIMHKHRIRKLLVVEGRNLLGIITQTDIVRLMNNFTSKFIVKLLDVERVEEIMNENVLAVSPDDSVETARRIMASHKVGCVVVAENSRAVGILTEKDYLSELIVASDSLKKFLVSYVMTKPVVQVPPHYTLFKANSLMLSKGFRRLPVSRNGTLAGIVTQTDIAKGMFSFAKELVEGLERESG